MCPAIISTRFARGLTVALAKRLDPAAGFNRAALPPPMRDHVLASGEIVGVYQRVENPPAGTR